MLLRATLSSPFARKVRLAAMRLKLDDQITMQDVDPLNAVESIGDDNPLRKIPALRLDDGTRIYDSRVILEYLDHLAGGGVIIPREWHARLAALTLQALADGILDAGVLIVYEGRYRPAEMTHAPWLDFQRGKIDRALQTLAAKPLGPDVHVGTMTAACALGYLDFRKQVDWRSQYPGLVGWLDDFRARVPEFDRTSPPA